MQEKTIHNIGIYIFKKGFNGDIIELVDEMQVVYNPVINTIFNIMEAVYKDVAEIKDSFNRKTFKIRQAKKTISHTSNKSDTSESKI